MLLNSVLLSRRFAKNLAIIGKDYRMSTSKLRVRPSASGMRRTFNTSTSVRPVNAFTRCSILLSIFFIANKFGANYHGCDNAALMHGSLSPFATRKPAFWCQKYEDQNDHTQEIPLPGVARVIPEEDLLKCGKQASHVIQACKLTATRIRGWWVDQDFTTKTQRHEFI